MHKYLVLIQEVLVFLVLSHALEASILSVKVVQVVVRVELPQRLVSVVRDVVSQEEVDCVLLSPICEGVAVVSSNGREQLPVLVHRPDLRCGGRAGKTKVKVNEMRYMCCCLAAGIRRENARTD